MRYILASQGEGAEPDSQLPYPFMLAHPLHERLEALGAIDDWQLEWKWDGIRAQLIRREGRTELWSRGDELVTGAFPDLAQAARSVSQGTVLDGEIVAWDEEHSRPFAFARLQRRLNRKHVELSFWPDVPVAYVAFDILELDARDVRGLSLRERRALLAQTLATQQPGSMIRLSPTARCESWDSAERLVAGSRDRGVEGLMLKRLDSQYKPGRTTGLWWKLKVQPYTVDAILIAAQPGTGKRAGLLTDYTFGVWDDGQIVPIAKAYSGLTDAEIADLDRWVRRHTVGRYGPVRAVEPTQVFELGFEAIQRSDRHKSGIAVRFPRILRIRTDKRPMDADSIVTMRALLAKCEGSG
jgi:DNA ligase-1